MNKLKKQWITILIPDGGSGNLLIFFGLETIITMSSMVMNVFDRIIVINLDTRPDRWNRIKQMFDKYGITNYERFSAIAPDLEKMRADPVWGISCRAANTKYAQKHKCPIDKYTRGALGCKMSHYHVILLAKERGYRNILILEDDAILNNDFAGYLKISLQNLPSSWHMLYLGGSAITTDTQLGIDDALGKTLTVEKISTGVVRRILKATHAYAVNSTFFDRLLEGIKSTPILEIDRYYANELQLKKQGNIFAVEPLVAFQDDMSLSDITMDTRRKLRQSNGVDIYCNNRFFHNKIGGKYARLTSNDSQGSLSLVMFKDVLKWECVPLSSEPKAEFVYIEGNVALPPLDSLPNVLLFKNMSKVQFTLLKPLFEVTKMVSDVSVLIKRSKPIAIKTVPKKTRTVRKAPSASRTPPKTGLCLLEGTLVRLSDGSIKMIQDITYNDNLLVWDFDNGCFSSSRPLWIKVAETTNTYNKLKFNDGTELCTVVQHRIFNKQRGQFTYPMTNDTPIGTITFKADGTDIVLTGKEICNKTARYYNIITDRHMNVFANDVLTSCRYNNIYPITDMRFIKDNREIVQYNDSFGIPRMYYDGMRLGEQQIPISESKEYIDRLIRLAVPRKVIFLDHQGVLALDGKTFDNDCVEGLKELFKAHPNLDVVVSSDWKRRYSLSQLRNMYRNYGLKEPIDCTPTVQITTAAGYPKGRSDEILSWLEQNKSVIGWACVDDLDMSPFLDKFVRTDVKVGLRDNHVINGLSKLLSSC